MLETLRVETVDLAHFGCTIFPMPWGHGLSIGALTPKNALFLLTGFCRLLCFGLILFALSCLVHSSKTLAPFVSSTQETALEGPYEDTAAFCAFKHQSIRSELSCARKWTGRLGIQRHSGMRLGKCTYTWDPLSVGPIFEWQPWVPP